MQGSDRLNERLERAVLAGDVSEARSLVAEGADLRIVDSTGAGLLARAARRGHAAMWRALRAWGAPTGPDPRGRRPGEPRLATWGEGRGRLWGVFVTACMEASESRLREICSADPGLVIGVDRCGRSGIHFAAMAGRTDNFRFLIVAGADPHETDRLGRSAWLELATRLESDIWREMHGAAAPGDFSPMDSVSDLVGKARGVAEYERHLLDWA